MCELRWSTWEVDWNPTQVLNLLETLEQNQKAIIRRILKKLSRDSIMEIQQPDEPALDSGEHGATPLKRGWAEQFRRAEAS